jgi:hypothetical protein
MQPAERYRVVGVLPNGSLRVIVENVNLNEAQRVHRQLRLSGAFQSVFIALEGSESENDTVVIE